MAAAGRRSKDVTCQAVSLDPHQDIFTVFDISSNKSDVGLLIENAFEDDHAEVAMGRGKRRLTGFPDESLRAQPVPNEIGDSDNFQLVERGKLEQVRNACHSSVFLHDLANDSSSRQTCRSSEVHGSLCLACAHKHPTIPRSERKDVTRPSQVAWPGFGID